MSLENQYERFVSYTDDHTILSQEDVIRFVLASDADNATLPFAAQCFPGSGKQVKYIVNDTTSSFNVTILAQSGDSIVGNVTLTPGRGCFAISDGAASWTLIGPSGAGGAGSVVEADFSFTDVVTANATSSAHGLMPKLTPGIATASQPVTLGSTKNLDTLALDALTGNDASLGITGLAAAQGGAIVQTGGTSSTAGNAGGAVSQVGGVPGVTGAGGAASLAGGAGGATSGLGGAATVTGGAGTNSNSAGGVATVTGGAGQGTAAGGVGSLVGGASGAGATGKGGAAKVTGGAALSTNDDGGGAVVAGGAKNGTGFIGPVVLGNAQLMPIWYPQAAPATDGGDTPFTATVAQMVAGLLSMTPTTGRTITLPTGTQMDAGVAFADVPATFGFDFTVQNRAAFAATDDIITLAAGASGMTVTGSATVAPGVTGRFRAVRTAANTWIIYKIAG